MFARSHHVPQNPWSAPSGSELSHPLARRLRHVGLSISLVPYLLGEGIPYFAELAATPIKLPQPKVVEGKGVTHL
jgi:hypothetical protein